jgi:hypothetical protein
MKPTLVWIGLVVLVVLFVGAYVFTRPNIDLTLHNVGATVARDVRLVGPGVTEVVGSLDPGAEVNVSFDVEADGELHVLFTVDGQKRRVLASGYETPNMRSQLRVDLGPNEGVPYTVTVSPTNGR